MGNAFVINDCISAQEMKVKCTGRILYVLKQLGVRTIEMVNFFPIIAVRSCILVCLRCYIDAIEVLGWNGIELHQLAYYVTLYGEGTDFCCLWSFYEREKFFSILKELNMPSWCI